MDSRIVEKVDGRVNCGRIRLGSFISIPREKMKRKRGTTRNGYCVRKGICVVDGSTRSRTPLKRTGFNRDFANISGNRCRGSNFQCTTTLLVESSRCREIGLTVKGHRIAIHQNICSAYQRKRPGKRGVLGRNEGCIIGIGVMTSTAQFERIHPCQIRQADIKATRSLSSNRHVVWKDYRPCGINTITTGNNLQSSGKFREIIGWQSICRDNYRSILLCWSQANRATPLDWHWSLPLSYWNTCQHKCSLRFNCKNAAQHP